jgi:hypothetical protein
MRLTVVAVLAIVLGAAPAGAFENFIPLGNNYSPDDPRLPPLNSEQDRINAQVDIYESEIYNRQRIAKSFSSQVDRFRYDQELNTRNRDFIDY